MFWIVNPTVCGQQETSGWWDASTVAMPLAFTRCLFLCVWFAFFYYILLWLHLWAYWVLCVLGDKWMRFTWRCPLWAFPHASGAFCLWAGWCLAAAYSLWVYFVEHVENVSGWQNVCACSMNSPALQWIFFFSQLHQKELGCDSSCCINVKAGENILRLFGRLVCALVCVFLFGLFFFLSCLMVFF